MALTLLAAMVRKDLLVFFSDRRAVIMSLVAPVAIASFFGSFFPGPGAARERPRIAIHIVDQDGSPIARSIVARAQGDEGLTVTISSPEAARAAVRRGKVSVAVILPQGFGAAAARALFAGQDKPQLDVLYDPSQRVELAMVRGILAQHVMHVVTREVFSPTSGRPYVEDALRRLEAAWLPAEETRALRDLLTALLRFYDRAGSALAAAADQPLALSTPYGAREEAIAGRAGVRYNRYAHAFAGMGVQFLLFAAVDLGVGVLLERQRGLWKRLRSAPVSRLTLLGGKVASGTIITLMTLLVSFGFAMLVFGVGIDGSMTGFLAVALASALMASAFGLFVAAVGNTPATTRGVASLAVLLMVMLGGAWVPTFFFPAWLQRLTVVLPTRWAVDGLDAMTWRGLGLDAAVPATAVLLGFAALFGLLATARFRWEAR